MKTLFIEIKQILCFEKTSSRHLIRSRITEEVKLSLAAMALLLLVFLALMLVFAVVKMVQ